MKFKQDYFLYASSKGNQGFHLTKYFQFNQNRITLDARRSTISNLCAHMSWWVAEEYCEKEKKY